MEIDKIWKITAAAALMAIASGSSAQTALESPGNRVFESGVGVIRGWTCESVQEVVVTIDDQNIPLAVGSDRPDTSDRCNNQGENGFGTVVYWPNFGMGVHTASLMVNGEVVANHTFRVSGAGTEFIKGLSATKSVEKFPQTDEDAELTWSEAHQNFVITAVKTPEAKALPATEVGAIVHRTTILKGESTANYSFTMPSSSQSYKQVVLAYNQRAEVVTICGDFAAGSGISGGTVCFGGRTSISLPGGGTRNYNFHLRNNEVASEDIRIVISLTPR